MERQGQLIYRLEDIELDAVQGCLRREGQEQRLRQKTLQVLLYLIEQRQQPVTREELRETIWPEVIVGDNALEQCLAEIRRSLGDNSRHPRFIRTIPKVGYCFIGRVEEVRRGRPTTIETREITAVEIEYEEEGPSPAQPAETLPRAMPAPGLKQGSLRRPFLFAIATVLLGAALALAIYVKPAKRSSVEVALPQVPGRKPLAVMYFENQSDSRELDWLCEGLADMLITDLSRSARLTVLGRQQLHLLLERIGRRRAETIRLDDAIEIGRLSQAETIILGSFAGFGDKLHISVNLYDARSGQLLTSESLVADKPADILDQVDLLSLKVASHLGTAPNEQAGRAPLVSVMTDNLDAYRNYSLAMEQVQMYQFPEATELLEKAVALDPQFAMAYARIGYIYAVRWGLKEKARPYLEKAFQRPDHLTDKDRLYITAWHASAAADPLAAIEIYQKMLAYYPLEVEAYQRLCWLLISQKRFDEALLTVKQGLTIDPESKDLYNGLGTVYYNQNKYQEAIAAYQRYVDLAPTDPNALDSLGTCLQTLGRYDEAIAAFQRALTVNAESRVAIIHLGNAYLQQGFYRAALEQYQRFLQIARDDWSRGRSYEYMAYVYLRWGDLNRAEAAARQSTRYYKQAPLVSYLVAFARGNRQATERLRDELLAKLSYVEASERGFLRLYYYNLGCLALKSGQAVKALEYFKESQQHQKIYWYLDPSEDGLANAYLEVGQLDDAIAEYERILSVNQYYPLAHYHLAQAYERKGEHERARAAYERFLQIWEKADPDIPELMAAKKQLQVRERSAQNPPG
jgi:tetratricopeptide (TPR) repeat protein/DNA-binding winged helix-turn-helix (wHTH) protein/TolB-like protein